MMDTVNEKLGEAERLWRGGNRREAVSTYDAALKLLEEGCAQNSDQNAVEATEAAEAADAASAEIYRKKRIEVLLGMGFALLNCEGTNEFVTRGLACLEEVRAHADAAGESRQVAFVDQLLQSKGKIDQQQKGESQCCDAPSISVDVSHESTRWTKVMDDALIQSVAATGLGNWQEKAAALQANVNFEVDRMDAAEVRQRWKVIAPHVGKALEDKDATRECGHSCSSCPSRQICELHDAVKATSTDLSW